MQTIKVMLVEDHPTFREAIELSLAEEPDIELVGQFGAAEVALRNLQDAKNGIHPDVILLDLNLPGMSGIKALPWIKQYSPDTRIIVLTQSDKKADVLSAIHSGANGYLLKSAPIEEITQGIHTVMRGGASLDAEVANLILNQIQSSPLQSESLALLTPREADILHRLGDGLLKKEIADELEISAHTVAEHVKRIYIKLEVKNAPAAVAKAYKTGLFDQGA
ncbi:MULTISPECIES: response regulator transcription factor [unclassified Lentimonas]|uniref:response regulator n=1 Tax=unclassified Lentimonas TaxID=2630993 RepID=UPI00132AEB53|nr:MULTISPECIES: response regulator transcription factor [unclassified Lentimonas]CAA6677756.1 Unannotated [Lentimonas sp. CC4]CAA6685020.1 Unannotated [Lentimonas sp. CC6]CAA7077862.1 Unannotated [Lentimonas sp. CC4]CAA7169790.1 Unannotated [Lentimonas sp. CC21]CAA7179908.1 Unannotated [Lentimonas sp. CC8]